MNRKRIIGIDPGKGGGVAIFWEDGKREAHPYKNDEDTFELLESIASGEAETTVFLELVGGFAGVRHPGSFMFNFGDGFGYYRGLLRGLEISTRLVRPQEWQKGIPGLKGLKGDDRKRALKVHAARIFPELKPTLKTCDAILIADWGRRQG